MSNKEKFISLLHSTKREGVSNIISALEGKGFFEAPASTKFPLSEEGGLLQHSINVCEIALKIRKSIIEMDESLLELLPEDSVVIAALLHDVCKADIYKKSIKRQKNSSGVWIDAPGYDVEYSNFPLGHGEKSVIMILRSGFELTDDEIIAIRWHMHAWDLPFQSYEAKSNLNAAKESSPLLTLIQTADGLSSAIIERTKK